MKANQILRHVPIASVLLALAGTASEANGQDRAERTKSEVDALIAQAGSTSPDWWNSVELEYPETLDLSWPVRQGFGEGPDRFGERGGRGRGQSGDPSARGSRMVKVEPLPGVLSARRQPPCCSLTMKLQMARPRPVPFSLVVK